MEATYCAQSAQKKIKELWQEAQPFAFDLHDATRPIYSIDTPPPTVSGSLHIGHLFSYTHTDFLARYHRMNGANVYYPMGFDDNGLPTERYVEKKHKTKAYLVGRSAFIALCLDEVRVAHAAFSDLWKEVGLSIDWNFTYSTISDQARKIAQANFLELLAQNNAYQTAEAALYCTTCQTSVAQAELDSMEQKTTFNTILFADKDGKQYPVATTRPELLPACVAVLFHPSDMRYAHLTGATLSTPFFEKEVPCLADTDVLPDKGTGLVMCCTFGDQTDIIWFKRHNLPLITIMDEHGTWTDATGPLAGKKVVEARKTIIALLKEHALLIEQKDIVNEVSIHERCKQPIEFRVIKQWFVKLIEHKAAFLERAQQIAWHPGYMQSRYDDWVSNLKWDWCISRQRFFGVPIPVWHCTSCDAVLTPSQDQLPLDPTETSYPGHACSCGSTDLRGETDVMDTWNISSLTPLINRDMVHNAGGKLELPFSLRPQAHDIIRTWAFYTIAKAHYAKNTIPWKSIVISGHVTQGSGKISKSAGGSAFTPEALLSAYSADALRYWAAKGNPGVDTAFSEDQLKMGTRLQTKLWNALRFISSFAPERENASQVPSDLLNQWLLERLSATRCIYAQSFEKAEYARALEALDTFFWHDLCDNYLELVKDRLNNPAAYNANVIEETKQTLHAIGFAIIQLYCPFIPFVTESIYRELYYREGMPQCLSSSQLARAPHAMPAQTTASVIAEILHVVSEVRRHKSEAKKSLREPLASLDIHPASHEAYQALEAQKTTLQGIAKAATCIVHTPKSGSKKTAVHITFKAGEEA